MKLLTIVFLALGLTTISQASDHKDFSEEALQLLSVVHNNCPIEFIQAMRGANRVGKAFYMSDRMGEKYTLTTVGGGWAPSFESWKVATLQIMRTPVRHESPMPMDMPTQWDVKCLLTNH